MVDLKSVLETIKNSYSKRKIVNFEESGLRFELEPLTSLEEIKVLEACKDIEGSQYIEGLKRHSLAGSIKKINDLDLSGKDVDYDADGETKTKSKFLYMVDYLSQWPTPLVDELFDAYTNMCTELETRIKKEAKFERFSLSEAPEEDQPESLRKVKEVDTPIPETETDRLNQKVEDELKREDHKISESENTAMSGMK